MLDSKTAIESIETVPAQAQAPRLGRNGHAGLVFRALWFAGRRTLLTLVDVEVRGRDNVPAGGCLLAANHLNWVDPFVLLAVLPDEPRLHFIGNAKDTANRWWKRLLTGAMGGLIPVSLESRAGYRELIARTTAVVKDGGIVGIFPEGRVGPAEGALLPLKSGVGYLAEHSGVPLIPVALSGASALYLKRRITVTFGPPVPPADAALPSKRRADATVEALRLAMEGMLHPYLECPGEVKRWRWLTKLM